MPKTLLTKSCDGNDYMIKIRKLCPASTFVPGRQAVPKHGSRLSATQMEHAHGDFALEIQDIRAIRAIREIIGSQNAVSTREDWPV